MSELRNIKWGELGKDLLSREGLKILARSHSLQWTLTYALRQQSMMVIDDLEGLVLEYKGIKFYPDVLNYPRMFEAGDRYRVERVSSTDIVLDLGANIGSFTLPAAKVAKKVIAVEPLFPMYLINNAKLNNLENVVVYGLAVNIIDSNIEVDCQEYRKVVERLPNLSELFIPKPTFLRMDIGGMEWNLPPNICEGIRDLEIEFHYWEAWQRKLANWPKWKNWLEFHGYGYRARWSKHRHWLYLSAGKEMKEREEIQLTDGSFRGKTREHWRVSSKISL